MRVSGVNKTVAFFPARSHGMAHVTRPRGGPRRSVPSGQTGAEITNLTGGFLPTEEAGGTRDAC